MAEIDATTLDRALRAAGIPIDGVSCDGRIDFQAEATTEQQEAAATLLASERLRYADAPENREPTIAETVADLVERVTVLEGYHAPVEPPQLG